MIEGALQRRVCDGSERTLMAYLVMQRNAGVPVETLLDKASGLPENDGERAIAQGRIRDVYLDRTLTVDTVTAYRATKCAKGRLLRDDAAFADEVRDGPARMPGAGIARRSRFPQLHRGASGTPRRTCRANVGSAVNPAGDGAPLYSRPMSTGALAMRGGVHTAVVRRLSGRTDTFVIRPAESPYAETHR